MSPQKISLFMWGYQSHFRFNLELLSEKVFETLGISIKPQVILVGIRHPDSQKSNPVCVEPENGKWPLDLFLGLTESFETIIQEHPDQNVFYSNDERSMREKPENIRCDSAREAVEQPLNTYDVENMVKSFCGFAHLVDEYYVVPVIQIPNSVFDKFPPLKEPPEERGKSYYRSFIHAAISGLLNEAKEELRRPDPGHKILTDMRSAEEIVLKAAIKFMWTPGTIISGYNVGRETFEHLNLISSLMYEKEKGTGKLFLASPENSSLDYALRFASPVPLSDLRWARKVLEMASPEIGLIANDEYIFGLGNLSEDLDHNQQNVFIIDFLDHYHWQIRCGDNILLKSRYGQPSLPQEEIQQDLFIRNYARLFPESTTADHNQIWDLYSAAIVQDHGALIVIASDGAEEAKRLKHQGMLIEPQLMTAHLLQHVCDIDGAIILDPHCVCHALGVIIDGLANDECLTSRGARYNSGIRYIRSSDNPRLAIVISDDRTLDIIPLLREQIQKVIIEKHIKTLEQSSLEDLHKPRLWLDKHRFYINAEQCKRINAELDRIEAQTPEVGQIVLQTRRFEPDPDMNDSYFL